MNNDEVRNTGPEKQELQAKIEDLEKEISLLKARSLQTSRLLFEFSKRTLLSSASIQTAVSSMLSENFLWDGSSDREFLEIIDESINFICNQLSLISMLMRIQSNKTDLRFDSYPVDEILNGMVESIRKRLKRDNKSHQNVNFHLPESSNLVKADYNYINTGLTLFLSSIIDCGVSITVTGIENETSYELLIDNCPKITADMVQSIVNTDLLQENPDESLYVDPELKIIVGVKLLVLQNIQIIPAVNAEDQYSIRIILPFDKNVEPISNL